MSEDNRKECDALAHLADLLVDEIINTSDEDILTELKEDGLNPKENAAIMRALFEKSLISMNKRRLVVARSGVNAYKSANKGLLSSPVNIQEARRLLRNFVENSSQNHQMTIAARKESELSDADILSMIEDLYELGVLPPTDKSKGD